MELFLEDKLGATLELFSLIIKSVNAFWIPMVGGLISKSVPVLNW
jgi:hypothetical protein